MIKKLKCAQQAYLLTRRHVATVAMTAGSVTAVMTANIVSGDHLLLQSWRTKIGFVEQMSWPKRAHILC